MFKKAVYTPSTSFVLSRIPHGFTEEDIKAFLAGFLPLENIEFHYLTPSLFLRTVTVVFPDMDAARRASMQFMGKKNGPNKICFNYSLKPYNLSITQPHGEVPTKGQIDDGDAPTNPFHPGYFLRDWAGFSEAPPIPPQTEFLSLRFNFLSSLSFSFATITHMNLKANNLSSISDSINFPKLTHCNLSYNLLRKSPEFLKFSPKIECMDLSHNMVETIHESFSDLASLESFDISFNCVKSLPKLPVKLSTLMLDHNEIHEIHDDCNPPLKRVSLWNNKLDQAPTWVKGRIDGILLINNNIRSMDFSFIQSSVQVLNLSNNSLTHIPKEIFKLWGLQQLILFNNQITEIPEEIYSSRLQCLDVSENPIEELPLLPISILTLKISFCQISDLSVSIQEQNYIQTLHANHNQLTFIPSLPEITELFVASNRLVVLPFFSTPIFTQVTLDASHNMIKTIPPLSSPFRLLDLSYNQLTTIPATILQHRSSVKLTGNNINMVISQSDLNKIIGIDTFRTSIQINATTFPKGFEEIITTYNGEPSTDTIQLRFMGDDSVGYAEMLGKRNEMEDAIIVRQNFKSDLHFFAVFDGHGGDNVARLAAASFPDLLKDVETIDHDSIVSITSKFQNTLLSSNEESGSTMQLVFVSKDSILISHLGDSRTVVFRTDGSVKYATEEQNPSRRSELERLRHEKVKLGKMRTSGFLAMSSSLGDFQVKGVAHIPETVCLDLDSDDRWIIIACDGLWDDVSNESAAKTLLLSRTPAEAAALLRDQSYSRGSEDNISVIVIDLKTLFK